MRSVTLLALLFLALPATVLAQLGLIFPSDDIVSPGENPSVNLRLGLFDPPGHRFGAVAKPRRFGVQQLGEQTDLLATLKPAQEQNTPWTAAFAIKRPGDHTFYAETNPQWQAADDEFVLYQVKLCVSALDLEEGWDEPIGLDAEIVPLSRPYGLWSGNLFSGQVLVNGEPAPYVAVEIAFLGQSPDTPATATLPASPYLVQKVRADGNGIFHYAMPRAGWWGFAATVEADWTVKRDGDEKPVSLVTSIWVATRDLN
jgi:cobalt/nickel transport protein